MTAKSLVSALTVLSAATIGAVLALAGSATPAASSRSARGEASVGKLGADTPAFAALPTMTDEQAVAFLATGKRPDGRLLQPAAPDFRLSEHDAAAVAADLRAIDKKS